MGNERIINDKAFSRRKRRRTQDLRLVLKPKFLGRDALREQLRNCLVKAIDQNGGLNILVPSHARALGRYRIPVEQELEDRGGVTAHVLLHVVGGKADEVEVYKDDRANKLLSEIDPSRLELFCPLLFRR
jgi:hypothetical protein